MPLNWKDFALASSTAVDKHLRDDKWPIYRYELKGVGEETYIYAPLRWVELPDHTKELERFRERARSIENEYRGKPEFAAWFEFDPKGAAFDLAVGEFGLASYENKPRTYVPLDYPDIFLQFARLVEDGPITPEVMLGWANQYGVLGLRRTMLDNIRSHRGGPEENVADFTLFAEEANFVLGLYDTIADPEGPDYKYVREHPRLAGMLIGRPLPMKTGARYEQAATGEEAERVPPWMVVSPSIKEMSRRADMEIVNAMPPERLKEVALEYIDETIHQRVSGECHPRLYRQKDGTARRGWGFKSLLGAMWLQMMWLRSATPDEVDRCPWCRKTIAFEPQPEQPEVDPGLKKNARPKYRTRDDKTFCNPRCRANWNYHFGEGKSSKYARKRERERRKSDDH
jgi:hypothetical protein